MNYLRKDDFKLIPFSNTGQGYNNLTYFPKNSLGTDFLQSNKIGIFFFLDFFLQISIRFRPIFIFLKDLSTTNPSNKKN